MTAQTQYPAAGRIFVEAFYIEVKLELTSGESKAFQGKGGIVAAGGNLEVGGYVSTADPARLFADTTGFTMTGDGKRVDFLDNNLGVLGHFDGTATGKPFGPSPGVGTGSWFAV